MGGQQVVQLKNKAYRLGPESVFIADLSQVLPMMKT